MSGPGIYNIQPSRLIQYETTSGQYAVSWAATADHAKFLVWSTFKISNLHIEFSHTH